MARDPRIPKSLVITDCDSRTNYIYHLTRLGDLDTVLAEMKRKRLERKIVRVLDALDDHAVGWTEARDKWKALRKEAFDMLDVFEGKRSEDHEAVIYNILPKLDSLADILLSD